MRDQVRGQPGMLLYVVDDSRKKPRSLTSGSLSQLSVDHQTRQVRKQTFRLVEDAGLGACLEGGLALAVLVVVALLSGVFFALDAGVFEAGFFPVTSWF